MADENCLFCKIIAGKIPGDFVHQDERCVVIRDINPQAPSHVLVIPREHLESLDDASQKDEGLLGHLLLVGARVDGDTGYNVELTAGATEAPGDWKLSYGYSVAEVDAVLAAFSHDDTTIATNYRQHSLVVNYALTKHVLLDLTWYRYRPYDASFALLNDPDDWLDRLRLHFLVTF